MRTGLDWIGLDWTGEGGRGGREVGDRMEVEGRCVCGTLYFKRRRRRD